MRLARRSRRQLDSLEGVCLSVETEWRVHEQWWLMVSVQIKLFVAAAIAHRSFQVSQSHCCTISCLFPELDHLLVGRCFTTDCYVDSVESIKVLPFSDGILELSTSIIIFELVFRVDVVDVMSIIVDDGHSMWVEKRHGFRGLRPCPRNTTVWDYAACELT